MFDRALYMRSITWENEQQEMARADASRDGSEEPQRALKVAPPRKADPDVETVKKSDIDENYCAVWDGSMSGLKIFSPIKMIEPKGS